MKKAAFLMVAMAMAGAANAQVDWTTFAITEVKTFAQTDTDSGLSGANVVGVTTDGTNLFLIAELPAAPFSTVIVRYDLPNVDNPVVLGNLDALDTTDSDVRLTGSFHAVGTNVVVADFQENAGADTTLLGVAKSNGALTDLSANQVNLEGMSSFFPFNATTLVATRNLSNGGDGSLRTIDLTTGTVSGVLVAAASLGTANAVAVDSATSTVYVSDTNGDNIVRVTDLLTTPVVTDVTPSSWNPPVAEAEVRNLLVGPDGELIAADRGSWTNGLSIRISGPSTDVVVPFTAIDTAAGDTAGTFSARDARGIAIDNVNATQSDIYAVNFTTGATNAALVRIRFGAPVASVENWNMY